MLRLAHRSKAKAPVRPALLLKQLPRRERKLLKRKYMDEAPDKEIAQELGVAPASVRTYLSRARNHLREIMEEMDK